MKQSQINDILVEAAKKHKRDCALEGWRSFGFGRGGEEAARLKQENIRFEIVPGVTSGVAVPCYAGIPVTDRRHASSVVFVTGQSALKDWKAVMIGRPSLKWGPLFVIWALAVWCSRPELPKHGRRWRIRRSAVIEWGTYDRQRVVLGTINDMPEKEAAQKIENPAIIVIGEVVNCRHEMAWYDARPLFGKRVLVTRSGGNNE